MQGLKFHLISVICAAFGWMSVSQAGMPARISESELLAVWGVAYQKLVEYPEQGLVAKTLVNSLVDGRNEYPLKMSLEQLHSVADGATQLYRKKGYKFHRVFVPEQQPELGLIEFSVLEATLGGVHIRGKEIDAEAINDVFQEHLHQPLYQPAIDKKIQMLKAQSGLNLMAYYSRGAKPGEVRLNIKVEQQKILAYAQADNYGAESTGRNRLLLGGSWYSPSGRLDKLSVGLMAAHSDEVNYYGYINYQMPLWNLDNELMLALSNNQFSIGQEFSRLDFSGDARIVDLKYKHTFSRSWSGLQYFNLGVSYKDSDYDSILNNPLIERDETANSILAGWGIDSKSASGGWRNQFYLEAVAGEYEVDGYINGPRDFKKVEVSEYIKMSIGDSGNRWSNIVTASITGQYSEDVIPSFEKFLMTGVYGVRAFEAGFYSSDRGALASLEWHFPWLINQSQQSEFRINPKLFIDAAYGEKLTLQQQVWDRAVLIGAGIGVDIIWGKHWQLQIVSATDLDQDVKSGLEVDAMRAFIRLNYHL